MLHFSDFQENRERTMKGERCKSHTITSHNSNGTAPNHRRKLHIDRTTIYRAYHLMFKLKWPNLHHKKSYNIRSLKGQHNAEQKAVNLRGKSPNKLRKDDRIGKKEKIRPLFWRVIKLQYNSWSFQWWETEFKPPNYPLYQRHVRREVKFPAFRFHMSVSSSLL